MCFYYIRKLFHHLHKKRSTQLVLPTLEPVLLHAIETRAYRVPPLVLENRADVLRTADDHDVSSKGAVKSDNRAVLVQKPAEKRQVLAPGQLVA